MTREELTIQIEQYLDGVLSTEEAKKLELLIIADDKTAKELAFHKSLREGIQAYYERLQLKNKMQSWEDDKTFPIPQKRQRNIWRPIMAAATISLLVTVGGVSLYHFVYRTNIDGEIKSEVKDLAKKVEQTSVTANKANAYIETDKNNKAVVPSPSFSATAFVLTTDGYLVTNSHVVGKQKTVAIEQQLQDKTLVTYTAEVVETNKKLDFALLKITDNKFSGFGKIPYSISDKNVTLAQKIYTLGFPKNDIVYSEGVISSLSGLKSDTMFYQINVIAAEGQSGSPVINEKGELLGVLTNKKRDADGETYCVKTKYILEHIERLRKENKIEIKTNQRSKLSGKKLTDQVNAVIPFVFIVKA